MSHIDEATLSAYLDGGCEVDDEQRIEGHVEACDACRALLSRVVEQRDEAAGLLGSLEPGPIHAPPFSELQARAAAATTPEKPAPLWRRPVVAWAASLVLAFGLGWMSRLQIGAPAPEQQTIRRYAPGAAGPAADAASAAETPEEEDTAAFGELAKSSAAPEDERAAAANEQIAAVDALEPTVAGPATPPSTGEQELAAAAPPARAAPEPQALPVSPDADLAGRRDQPPVGALVAGAERQEQARVAREALAAQEYRQATPQAAQPATEPLMATASAGTGGFFALPIDEAEAWLGATPRQLPDFALARVELVPGASMPDGDVGRPVLRLAYTAASGQEIVLEQQYLGALAPTAAEALGDRPAARREGVVGAAGADDVMRARVLDRDARLEANRDLPVRSIDPNGLATYRWMDAEGYLLSLSGRIDADVLQGLAEQVR